MRTIGFLLLITACLEIGLTAYDWLNTVAQGGSIGIGTSAFAATNFLMGIALAVLSVAFNASAERAKTSTSRSLPPSSSATSSSSPA